MSYDVLETVDTMNCEIIETVMILLLPVIGPRLLCAAMCSQKVKTPNFSEKQKRHFRRLYEDRTVIKSAFVCAIWN